MNDMTFKIRATKTKRRFAGFLQFVFLFCAVAALSLPATAQPAVRQARAGSARASQSLVLSADVVADEGTSHGWIVIEGDRIKDVLRDARLIPLDARVIDLDGYAYPGFIDTHNHVHWNVIPKWSAGRLFNNRYEWQLDPVYLYMVSNVYGDRVLGRDVEDEAIKYGEIRAIMGGATLIQSRYAKIQPEILIRNLDKRYKADSYTPDIRKLDDAAAKAYLSAFDSGELKRLFFHIGEGKSSDPTARAEFEILRAKGLVRPGVVLIHGVALCDKELQDVKDHDMYIVWSPRCNLALYGETLNIEKVLDKKIDVALAPDWAITGSSNLLDELRFANAYVTSQRLTEKISAKTLYDMVTKNAAKVAGVEDRLGQIRKDFLADIVFTRKLDPDPYKSLLKTYSADVDLVLVGGKPVYGAYSLMGKLNPDCNRVVVNGREIGVVTTGNGTGDRKEKQEFAEIEDNLRQALPAIAPLHEE